MDESKVFQNEYHKFTQEIRGMYLVDQRMRERALKNNGVIEPEEDGKLDEKNTERMKQIIKEIGWPTTSKVGKNTSHMAWLLVQHADQNINFQKECLQLMKSQPKGEVVLGDIAYLEDRIMVNEKKPQIYGTQFYETIDVEGRVISIPRPIFEEDQVDKRRKSMGMDSFEEGRRDFLEKYKDEE